MVQTDGGRYDVNVSRRIRTAAYWEEKPKTVMRCSWFYKSTTESRLHPYDENTAFNLEEEYKKSVQTNNWNRKVDLPSGDHVIMYGPNSIALFPSRLQTPEGWEAETVSAVIVFACSYYFNQKSRAVVFYISLFLGFHREQT